MRLLRSRFAIEQCRFMEGYKKDRTGVCFLDTPVAYVSPQPPTSGRGWTAMGTLGESGLRRRDLEATPLLPRTGSRAGPTLGSAKQRSVALLKDAAERSGDDVRAARLSDVITELDKDQAQNNLLMGFALFTILNHFLGGIFTMHFLEGWPLADCAYFTVVVTTTVGYGDMAPEHRFTKLYMCYFVLAAVSLISTCLAYTIGLLIDKQEELLLRGLVGERDDDDAEVGVSYGGSSETQDAADSAAAAAAFPNRPILAPLVDQLRRLPFVGYLTDFSFLEDFEWLSDYKQVFATGCIFLVVVAFGVWVFMRFEGLDFIDALYVTIISATTVGFGDIDPTRRSTKSIMTVWLIVSTLTLAKLMTDQSDAYVRSRQRNMTRRLLSAQLDTRSLMRMDTDGDGSVDKAEYLKMMLISTNKCSKEDLDEFLKRFAELDANGSGLIDPSDIKAGLR